MTNQLTLLFLVVVISGALCTVEDYVIMSQCAHNKAIYLAAEGTVSVTDILQTQNITIVGRPDFVNNNFKIALYAKETQRYLCFNDHWKLVGMKELQDTCYFNEAIVHGYFVFRSVVNQQRRIGFTQRGRAVGPKKTVNDACYMFTKIPTDQFFHQHNHFSSLSPPKSRSSSTTKPPKTEFSGGSGAGGHLGRGSGGGRPKTNRHRNQQHRNEDSAEHGGGSSKQHSKKPKVHNNGRRRQQHQPRLQQLHGGHANRNSLSDPKNSTYSNSSRQNVELSQYGGHNHTGKHHNHTQPQYHQTRHHHSESRRHHHDTKQKTRAHHRARVNTSPAAASASTTMSTEQAANTSTKPKLASSSKYEDIKPTSVVQPMSTTVVTATTTSTNQEVLATSVAHKRKGRRRKSHRKHTLHKTEQVHESENSAESYHSRHHGHGTMSSYDDEEEYMTTDLTTWINQDISAMESLASVKPTSANLPTWETWYPSASTPSVEETSDSSASTAAVASYEKIDIAKALSTGEVTSSSSSSLTTSSLPLLYDISKKTLPLMPLPFPTTAFSTSHADNNIDDAISPTETMSDLGTKTINTSTFSESKAWSASPQQRQDDTDDDDLLTTKLAESKAEEIAGTESLHNNIEELENATSSTIASSEVIDGAITQASADLAETTNDPAALDATPTKSTESHASTVSGGNMMTDYIYATRTVPKSGNHKASRHRHGDHGDESQKHSHKALQHNNNGGIPKMHHKTKNITVTSGHEVLPTQTTTTTTTTIAVSTHLPEAKSTLNYDQALHLDVLLTADKNINANQSHNTVTDTDATQQTAANTNTFANAFSSTASTNSLSSPLPPAATTTRKTLRKSTQRLLATPFHQLTYVRNEAGDIDIDSLDNISIYPDLLDNDSVNDDDLHKSGPGGTSRFTMISGYLPTSATATLPESIRIAKIKINRERMRMLRLRNIGGYNA